MRLAVGAGGCRVGSRRCWCCCSSCRRSRLLQAPHLPLAQRIQLGLLWREGRASQAAGVRQTEGRNTTRSQRTSAHPAHAARAACTPRAARPHQALWLRAATGALRVGGTRIRCIAPLPVLAAAPARLLGAACALLHGAGMAGSGRSELLRAIGMSIGSLGREALVWPL